LTGFGRGEPKGIAQLKVVERRVTAIFNTESTLAAWRRPLTTEKKLLTSSISEQEVIDRAKRGDPECFEALYGLHKRRVYPVCLRMTGNTADAEDLTQEAFLQLYRKIATFRGESAFSTWLHRLTVNVVLMHLRKKRLPEISLEETLESQQQDGPKKEIGARDELLTGVIDRVVLERSVARLAPGYRIVFALHDVEGYEHKEIAGMMGYSTGNSKSQLHKARMKLRNLLQLSRSERPARRTARKKRPSRAQSWPAAAGYGANSATSEA
jgi:RNA polymerase sigma-70 factor (ECF subfamily)